jgi:TM2 domain
MPASKSKTLATWLALVAGVFGAHRFYLRGARDVWAWLHALPTLAGLYGVQRVQALGQDDRIAWLLLPLLGLMSAQACLCAIVYGLTSDAAWAERHRQALAETRWGPVLGVIGALMIGATALMATIAFSGQRFFEWQAGA